MIDIHCHILPVMDDGPKQLSEFQDMARAAVSAGITQLFATPHHLKGSYNNPKTKILDTVRTCNNYLQHEGIPLVIHPGQELRIHRELFLSFERGEVLTLGNRNKYLLLELPSKEVPIYIHEVIYELLLKGITPIIVHPERNEQFIEQPQLLFHLIEEGALAQLTAGSLIGSFGKKIKSFSEIIIKHNLAHFIASDAHNVQTRGFFLREAYAAITKKFGISYAFYLSENAELLANGNSLQIEKPISITRKFLKLF